MKIVFYRAYLCQKMIDLRQAKTKMVTGLLQAYVEYIPPAEMLCLCDIVCNYAGGPRVSAATWPCVYLLEIQRCIVVALM